MEINEMLKEAGLTGNEAKVYLELLKKIQLSANQIAKSLGMDRTLVYNVLNHLIEKGQVNYVVKENKKFFSISNPDNLLSPVKAREVLILDLIKELKKIKSSEQQETEINVYEGKAGIRNFFRELMKEKDLCAFGSTGRAYDLLFESPAFAKEAEKKKIKMRIIANEEVRKKEFSKYKNLKMKFLDLKSEATTTIFGDKVSIHLIKEKPVIIIIKNKEIAQSYRNYFEFMWEKPKDKPKGLYIN